MRLFGVINGLNSAQDRAFYGFLPPFDLGAADEDTDEVKRALDMSFSLVKICNMALGKCGITKQIGALDFSGSETVSQEEMMCAQYFELAFRAAARGHDWKCLTTQADISGNTATSPVWGFDYSYSLPSNCIRVLALEDTTANWKIHGRLLCTDATDVKIEYIQYTLNTDLWDDLFVEALVMRLAAHLAPALCGEGAVAIADALLKWHERVTLPGARWADSTERSTPVLESSSWRDSRR